MISGFQKNQLPAPLVDKVPGLKMRLSRENRLDNKRKKKYALVNFKRCGDQESPTTRGIKALMRMPESTQRNQTGVTASSVMARAQRKFRFH